MFPCVLIRQNCSNTICQQDPCSCYFGRSRPLPQEEHLFFYLNFIINFVSNQWKHKKKFILFIVVLHVCETCYIKSVLSRFMPEMRHEITDIKQIVWWWFVCRLLDLVTITSHGAYVKLTVSSLDYTKEGMCRMILSKALTATDEVTFLIPTCV